MPEFEMTAEGLKVLKSPIVNVADDRWVCELKVLTPEGFHLRPISKLVEAVKPFRAKVTVFHGAKSAAANGMFELLEICGNSAGAQFRIEAVGDDAASALERIRRLFATEFDFIDRQVDPPPPVGSPRST